MDHDIFFLINPLQFKLNIIVLNDSSSGQNYGTYGLGWGRSKDIP